MLQRKEAARLSMTLDIEGQGVSYRIQEPASFPLKPSGILFIHFAILGPILGFLIPLGLIVLYVLVDPHFRSARALQRQLPPDVELIGVVPHYRSPLSERLFKKDMIFILIVLSGSLVAYISIAIFWHLTRS